MQTDAVAFFIVLEDSFEFLSVRNLKKLEVLFNLEIFWISFYRKYNIYLGKHLIRYFNIIVTLLF